MVGFGSIFSLLMRIFVYELRIEETPHAKKRTQEDLNESETEDEDHKRFKSKKNGAVDRVEGENKTDFKTAEDESGANLKTIKVENEADSKTLEDGDGANVKTVKVKNGADFKTEEGNGVIAETFKIENKLRVDELKSELGEIKKRSQLVVKNALDEFDRTRSQAINAEIKNTTEIKKNL